MRPMHLITIASLIAQLGLAQEASVPTSIYYERKADLFRYLPNDLNEIILLGNSITDGGNWSELLGDIRVKNRGISADVTRGILNRSDEVLESQPLKIFLLIGINDLAKGASQENILANIASFIHRVKQESPQTHLYIQSLLPVNPHFDKFPKHATQSQAVKQVNEKLALLCQELNVEYLDLYTHFANEEGLLIPEYTNDGLHLSGKGYLVWRDILKPLLNN